jgi:hypothetical protein
MLVSAVVGALLVLLSRPSEHVATAQEGRQPFASSLEQRQQTVDELRRLNELMQKQLELLSSGKLRVIVVERTAAEKAEPKGR